MVLVHRLDGKQMYVNADHILTIETLPDTILSLTTGARVLVKDTPAELVERVADFRRRCVRPEVLPPPQE